MLASLFLRKRERETPTEGERETLIPAEVGSAPSGTSPSNPLMFGSLSLLPGENRTIHTLRSVTVSITPPKDPHQVHIEWERRGSLSTPLNLYSHAVLEPIQTFITL